MVTDKEQQTDTDTHINPGKTSTGYVLLTSICWLVCLLKGYLRMLLNVNDIFSGGEKCQGQILFFKVCDATVVTFLF